MNPASPQEPAELRQWRRFLRHEVQCRARIRIGPRQYAGYLHNISRGGAKLRTITPIRKLGRVILRLPDLPPLQCALRWMDSHNAGVAFDLELPPAALAQWLRSRSSAAYVQDCMVEEEPAAPAGEAGACAPSPCTLSGRPSCKQGPAAA